MSDQAIISREHGPLRGTLEANYYDGPVQNDELVIDITCQDGSLKITAVELTGNELQIRVQRDWDR